MKPFLAAAMLALLTAPALALTLEEEQAAIEAACNGVGLGEVECACIAADAAVTLDPEMRNFLLMSFEDDAGFTVRANDGEFGQDNVIALIDYQQYVLAQCAPTDPEGE
jgi:hypothetical protein